MFWKSTELNPLKRIGKRASHHQQHATYTLQCEWRLVDGSSNERLNAVLHHSRNVVGQATRVFNLHLGRNTHKQSDNARKGCPNKKGERELSPVRPDNLHFSHRKAEKRENRATIEVVVEGELPAVLDHIFEVTLKENGIERTDQTCTHAKQSALQREIDFSFDSCNVASD